MCGGVVGRLAGAGGVVREGRFGDSWTGLTGRWGGSAGLGGGVVGARDAAEES